MTAEETNRVVSANRLRDGVPIYFAGNGVWSPKIAEAVCGRDGDALLVEAQAGEGVSQAIDPYLIDVAIEQGAISPVGLRERIRAFGPTA